MQSLVGAMELMALSNCQWQSLQVQVQVQALTEWVLSQFRMGLDMAPALLPVAVFVVAVMVVVLFVEALVQPNRAR